MRKGYCGAEKDLCEEIEHFESERYAVKVLMDRASQIMNMADKSGRKELYLISREIVKSINVSKCCYDEEIIEIYKLLNEYIETRIKEIMELGLVEPDCLLGEITFLTREKIGLEMHGEASRNRLDKKHLKHKALGVKISLEQL